jgi:hypothetical protein
MSFLDWLKVVPFIIAKRARPIKIERVRDQPHANKEKGKEHRVAIVPRETGVGKQKRPARGQGVGEALGREGWGEFACERQYSIEVCQVF